MNLTSCTAYFTIFSISLSRHILLREEKQMKNWLEKQFRLSEFHTDVKTEILAGLTTFVTICSISAFHAVTQVRVLACYYGIHSCYCTKHHVRSRI